MEDDLQQVPLLNGDTGNNNVTFNTRKQNNTTQHHITVENPEKHGEGVKDAYVTFDVCEQNMNSRVKRRYQDFYWLHERLKVECPCVILPPVPDRHSLLDMLIDRFSPDFINKRQHALQRYLERLCAHSSIVNGSRAFHDFMTKDYLGQESTDETTMSGSSVTAHHDDATDTDTSSSARSNTNADPETVSKWQSTAKLLSRHCDALSSSLGGVVKAAAHLATACQDSAASHDRLATVLDLQFKSGVERRAAGSAQEARRLDRLNEQLETKAMAVFQEYHQWMLNGLLVRLQDVTTADHTMATLQERQCKLQCDRDTILHDPHTGSSAGLPLPSSSWKEVMSRLDGYLTRRSNDPMHVRQGKLEAITKQIDDCQQEIKIKRQVYSQMQSTLNGECQFVHDRFEADCEGLIEDCNTIMLQYHSM